MSEAAYFLHQQKAVRRSFLVVCLVSIVALAASFWLEMFANVEPCKLCQVQRSFYFLTLLSATVGAFSSSIRRAASIFVLLLSLCNFATAGYQLGIQLGIVPDMCAVISPFTLHDFKSMLFQKQHALDVCSTITWVFGLPVVVWSMISSLICLFVLAKNWALFTFSVEFSEEKRSCT